MAEIPFSRISCGNPPCTSGELKQQIRDVDGSLQKRHDQTINLLKELVVAKVDTANEGIKELKSSADRHYSAIYDRLRSVENSKVDKSDFEAFTTVGSASKVDKIFKKGSMAYDVEENIVWAEEQRQRGKAVTDKLVYLVIIVLIALVVTHADKILLVIKTVKSIVGGE